METSVALNPPAQSKIGRIIQSLGPGIMMATAAVGGSHLVASTKAGAIFGWQLALLILLVNVLKYPFFRAGVIYTHATSRCFIKRSLGCLIKTQHVLMVIPFSLVATQNGYLSERPTGQANPHSSSLL